MKIVDKAARYLSHEMTWAFLTKFPEAILANHSFSMQPLLETAQSVPGGVRRGYLSTYYRAGTVLGDLHIVFITSFLPASSGILSLPPLSRKRKQGYFPSRAFSSVPMVS